MAAGLEQLDLTRAGRPPVAVVHDFLTQFGGGERTVLSMLSALPEAPLITAFYDPDATYPAFRTSDVRTLPINRVAVLRRNHRLALPVLGQAFSHSTVDADVVICSSAGWAHGIGVTGRKVVYCHTPARWLYQRSTYAGQGIMGFAARSAGFLRSPMRRWDRKAAATADRYLVNSSMIAGQVAELYGVEAEVLPPPPTLVADGRQHPVGDLDAGYLLCVCRLLPYKNVHVVVDAFRSLPAQRLVVVGAGPYRTSIERIAPSNVSFAGSVTDDELRWLYAHCSGIVSAAYEDYGLTPLEAALFGKPAAVLRWGGFLDTVVEGQTGVFFAQPTAAEVAAAVGELQAQRFDPSAIAAHAEEFSFDRFRGRLRAVVAEEAQA